MSSLQIEKLSHRINGFALRNIDLQIDKGAYFVLLGPSGSGKTRLLESIAGLNPSSGSIRFEETLLSDRTPEARQIGFVYQDFALFPNLNVEENIRFSGKYRKIENVEEHFRDITDFLDIGSLLQRKIGELSGGEKQRVALARALYAKPKILLLDEPLSAIDPTFKNSIMKRLKEIHRHYGLTTIHVTHNFREASYLADKIAIIMEGEIRQVGAPNEVLNRPKNMQIAQFLGYKNIFPTTLLGERNGEKYFSIDPNHIAILDIEECDTKAFRFDGVVEECVWVTDHFKLYVRAGENLFFIKILKTSKTQSEKGCPAQSGDLVTIGFDQKDIYYI
jgi:molybdate/tungstate transport system ATP-binding protein